MAAARPLPDSHPPQLQKRQPQQLVLRHSQRLAAAPLLQQAPATLRTVFPHCNFDLRYPEASLVPSPVFGLSRPEASRPHGRSPFGVCIDEVSSSDKRISLNIPGEHTENQKDTKEKGETPL